MFKFLRKKLCRHDYKVIEYHYRINGDDEYYELYCYKCDSQKQMEPEDMNEEIMKHELKTQKSDKERYIRSNME